MDVCDGRVMGQRVVGSPVRRSRVLTSLSTDSAWTACTATHAKPSSRSSAGHSSASAWHSTAPQPGSGCCTSSALGRGKTDMSLGFRHEPQTEASLNKAESEVPRFAYSAPLPLHTSSSGYCVGGSDRGLCARSAVKCPIAFLVSNIKPFLMTNHLTGGPPVPPSERAFEFC